MKRLLFKFKAITLLLLLISVQSVVAQNNQEMSLADASNQIRNKTSGKVLSAKTTHYNGRNVHRIQVLTPSGRVKVYQVPADQTHPKKNNNRQYFNGNQPSNYYPNNRPNIQPRTNNYSNRPRPSNSRSNQQRRVAPTQRSRTQAQRNRTPTPQTRNMNTSEREK